MSRKAFFEFLGAPLKNHLWSWGAVRESDGAVFLCVWNDKVYEDILGVKYVEITRRKGRRYSNSPGYPERLEHVKLLQEKPPNRRTCYLIMCDAVVVDGVPRKIKRFDATVHLGGELKLHPEHDGVWTIEIVKPVPATEAAA